MEICSPSTIMRSLSTFSAASIASLMAFPTRVTPHCAAKERYILKMLFPHDYGAQASGRSVHCCYRSNRGNGDWEEWQVETLAAMILLPPECVVRSMERFGLGTQMRLLNRVFAPADYKKFEAMASFMGASKTALSIRMMQLGLLKRNDLSDPYSLVRVEMDEEDRIL